MSYLLNGVEVIDDGRNCFISNYASITNSLTNFIQVTSTVAGYTSGGYSPTGASNIIDRFPFASDANATDVGDLTVGRYNPVGQSSTVSGYTSGGRITSPTFLTVNVIDRFPFASDANATDVGDLTVTRGLAAGQSSNVSGYTSGGATPPFTFSNITNIIDRFPFASDANATDVGDLTVGRYGGAGQSSSVSGYTSGNFISESSNVIDKFPFATNANATDVGDLTVGRYNSAGQSSTTHGYTSGGLAPPNVYVNVIDKFPFASDANATDVGDLTVNKRGTAGQSSSVSGYTSGGFSPPFSNVIDRFPFASDANATDVGDLTVARFSLAGQEI